MFCFYINDAISKGTRKTLHIGNDNVYRNLYNPFMNKVH